MSIQHSDKKMLSAKNDISIMLDRMQDTNGDKTLCPFIVYTEKCRLLYSGNDNKEIKDAAFTYKTRRSERKVEPVEKGFLYLQNNKDTELNLKNIGNAVEKDEIVNLFLNYFIKENFNNNQIRRSCMTAEKMRMVAYNPISQEFNENMESGMLGE